MKRFNKKEIRCLGGTYLLSFAPLDSDIDLRGESVGMSNMLVRTIKIALDVPGEQQKDTLLHELVHIADWETARPVDRLDEADVVRLSKALYAILRDNPGLAEWIASDDQ